MKRKNTIFSKLYVVLLSLIHIFYTGEQWLEIMPQKASKAQAALQLKQKLECDRLVVFGDENISKKYLFPNQLFYDII